MSTRRPVDVLAAMTAQAPMTVLPPSPTGVRSGGRRSDMVRFTFDVSRPQHRFIKQYVLESDATASAATRLLWQLVQEDSTLAERLRAALTRDTDR